MTIQRSSFACLGLALLLATAAAGAGGSGAASGQEPPPAGDAGASPRAPGAPTDPGAELLEELRYRWYLGGLFGQIARLVVPGQGEGSLTRRLLPSGRLVVELKATSRGARSDEYWLYGCELDPGDGHTVRAWTESHFRGRHKRHEEKVDEPGVECIPSAIRRLRRDPPREPLELLLWSEGKVYPVVVEPVRVVQHRVEGEVRILDYLRIEGVERPGRRRWRGSLELWLDRGAAAEPVEIILRRRPGRLHLLLEP